MNKVKFEWDDNKNKINHKKHGVYFEEAQYAFAYTNRIIAEDVSHSIKETRYYCFGKIETGIIPRFTIYFESRASQLPQRLCWLHRFDPQNNKLRFRSNRLTASL